MTTFIIIAVLVALFFLFVITKGKKEEETKENSVSMPYVDVSVSTEPDENETYNEPIKQVSDGWVINPGCPFELTVIGCDSDIASQLRALCDQSTHGGYYRVKDALFKLFVENRIRIKEIEEYKNKYSSLYHKRLEELKEKSEEFIEAGPKDKESILEELKCQAQDCIYELPEFDVYKLFVEKDTEMYNELIQRYGGDCSYTYINHFGRIGSVIAVDKQNSRRTTFEKMTKNGMALQGKDIPISDILYSQSLKTLNAIANNQQKEYKRKNQAIEYILEHDEAVSRIEEFVAFRDLFKLNNLPYEYDGIDIESIKRIFDCVNEEILLLMRTYNDSLYMWEQLQDKGSYKKCKIFRGCDDCKCASDRQEKTYSTKNIPKIPCHIGCTCDIEFVE